MSTAENLKAMATEIRGLFDVASEEALSEISRGQVRKMDREFRNALKELSSQPGFVLKALAKAVKSGDYSAAAASLVDKAGLRDEVAELAEEARSWRASGEKVGDAALAGRSAIDAKRANLLAKGEKIGSLMRSVRDGYKTPGELKSAVDDLLGELAIDETKVENAREHAENARKALIGATSAMRQGGDGSAQLRDAVSEAADVVASIAESPAPVVAAEAAQPPPNEMSSLGAPVAAGPIIAPVVLSPLRSVARFSATPSSARVSEPARGRSATRKVVLVDDAALDRRLLALLNREVTPFQSNMALSTLVKHFRPGSVGALHVTCTDECETESRASFQRSGIGAMLPRQGAARGAPVLTSNRGGCFEAGSLAVADKHFAGEKPFVVVVRIQSHCGVTGPPKDRRYGAMLRYGRESKACGALDAVLSGDLSMPRVCQVAESIDPAHVEAIRGAPENLRSFHMAVLQARTQIERASDEALADSHDAHFIFFGSVHLSGAERDLEVPVFVRVLRKTGSDFVTRDAGVSLDPRSFGALSD